MSQFPHDQFDDVQPYRQDEVGKHRAPGAAVSSGAAGGSSGALKWVGLLLVAVLVAVAVGWFVTRDGDDDDAPVADDENGQEEIESDEGEGEEGSEDEGGDGEENGESEEVANGLSDEYPVRAVNAGAPDGSAGDLSSRMEELGLQVDQSIDWNPDWGNANTPQVIYPEDAQQELAEAIAEALEIDSVNLGESWSTIVVVIGSEYEPAE